MTFHARVPRSLRDNLMFRRGVSRSCLGDREQQIRINEICRQDLLFWINTFGWTLDPRKLTHNSTTLGARTPFITWDYQEEALRGLEAWLEKPEDGLIEKSRDMGASWIVCGWMLWRWLYRDHQSFLMVSRKEMLVDGDEDSLFAHIRFMMKGLPLWMIPKGSYKDIKLQLQNFRNGSVIDGESTTSNIGRGGRRTSILCDEFAAFEGGGFEVLSATADNTNCRIFNSTPMGTANAFFAQREKGTSRIRMHWSKHPEKKRGLYRPLGSGRFELLDPTFDYTGVKMVDEAPRSEEGLRSPWYDRQCERRAHAWEIAQELDIDYQGSSYPFFDPRMMDEIRKEFCREPVRVGRIEKRGNDDAPEYVFVDDPKGHVKLWCHLDAYGKPPGRREYLAGCDVAQGTGASDSAVSLVDQLSGEKVAEAAFNRWSINEYAEIVWNLCHFFQADSLPYLIWEATGPGRTFGKVIVEEMHYPRHYMDKEDSKVGSRPSEKYGWFSTIDRKRDLLQTYRELLKERRFINPSFEAIREAGFYIFEGGRIEYRGPTSSNDPSNAGVNHGDRVVADALCAKLLFESKGGRPRVNMMEERPLPGSWLERQAYNSGMPDPEGVCAVDRDW